MTIDITNLRALRDATDDTIEMEYTGGSYSEHRDPTPASRAFYEAAHAAIPGLLDQLADATAACQKWRSHFTDTPGLAAANAEIVSLRAEIDRMRPVYDAALRFPDSYGGMLVEPPGDWACIECKPHSDWPNINNGWRCPVHALLNAIAEIEAKEPRAPGDGYCTCGERLDKEHSHHG